MGIDRDLLTRRRLLGLSGAGLATGGLAAVGQYRPTALPPLLADWATNLAPEPPSARELWEPTVTRDHAETVVSLYEDVQEESLTLREEYDGDDREYEFGLPSGWLESAAEALEAGNYNEAVRNVTYGIEFEAEHLGALRAELDRPTLEPLAERSADVIDRIDAVRTDVDSYPVEAPERDLAWHVRIDAECQYGLEQAHWTGLEAVRNGEEPKDISLELPDDVGRVTVEAVRATIHALNAEQYRDRLLERLENPEPYESHLQSEIQRLSDDLDGVPTADDVTERYIDDEEEWGPYEFVHDRLARWLFPSSIQSPWRRSVDEEYLAIQALGMARGLADWRAHDRVVDALVIESDDDGFDPGHALDAKRAGKATYDERIGTDPAPFLSVFAEQGIGALRVVEIDRDSVDEHWTLWRERSEAYLYALLGSARLNEYPSIYERLVDGPSA